ncbi:GNAT family N-acetyltransferase [Vibrio cyclitrophicus]|uniref:GNAT family N-acetyltransferase n=1 Tax=Vibrio cyclitrophicus TaxID=47951 RepID=UPI00029B2493|nr:GNAT family N-acetyltransferase [Vibrio cyclitrophicus]OBS91943.1 alanine acetyltransferase [Vibrio cyclitrophicus]OBT20267.1 alanine acetyltransferase [Vibrio cyclitrophicus]OED88842.1 alanine acetyltransferase [Vibrio cyclitrophicus ZF30]OEE12105.1 alanine acetyltransferase [Vibrio cyclitrophicus ZF207]OEE24120.1 alanine acetyltransferase [Vibrio cyclitrophicus ZF14]
MDVFLHLLHPSDVSALLEFEVENREWFEQFVPAREDRFYSNAGAAEQVMSFLTGYDNGEMIPMLVKDANGTICGRINVRDIDQNAESGELGYRVGHAFGSKGIASNAVRKLLIYLAEQSTLKYVDAYALVGNVGSNKILSKAGFDLVAHVENYVVFKGQNQDANHYRKAISSSVNV